ncbi:MAG: outer membrane lipoprotein-sorting protein, partial [Spirochaetales bacterium]|nr:outer membrane lipoprotein-sorting protein [Spirochaetales bacterium]
LSISYEDGKADDQFIYLPALKRTKRIASDNKNDSFMGSDFTYDDMGSRHPDLDTHTILRRETVQGVPTIVVQSESKSAQEYPKTISWIVDGQWYGMKKEFYDKSGKLAKTLVIDEIKTVDGIHIIGDMTMSNLTKRTSTRIRMDDVRFDVDLDERFFSERQMQIGPRR